MEHEILAYQRVLVMIIPLVFAVVVHEVAHGWVALQFGDKTAQMLGRLTLNPIKHVDIIGTIVVPCLLAFFGGFIFGWAKPVPVNWRNLGQPRRDMALVAFAGPATNLIMACLWAICLGLTAQASDTREMSVAFFFMYMCIYGVIINVVLFVLNMLPIPPLDGSRIVTSFLPDAAARTYNKLEPFGFFILLGLIFTGVLQLIMMPLVKPLMQFIQGAFM